MIMVFKQTI